VILDRILERRRENDPAELAKSLRGMGTGIQPSLWQDLSQLQTSVLVMAGEMDLRYKKIAQEIGNLRLKVRVAIVPGAGHNVHTENPAGFIRALRHFLTKQE
jgi:pimeloyl-ACP methyl ester carboxylesterase